MICSKCGHELRDGSSFCVNCGAEVSAPDNQPTIKGWDYCPHCGSKIPMNTTFCGTCGTKIENPIPTIGTGYRSAPSLETQGFSQEFVSQTPVEPTAFTLRTSSEVKNEKPIGMNWYKFLIFFALFFGSLLNLLNGISYITGICYTIQNSSASIIYGHFPVLSYIDKVYGISLISLAVFGIYTRSRLAKFCENGPFCYYSLIVLLTAVSVFYALSVYLSLAAYNAYTFNLSMMFNDIMRPIANIILLIANVIYFNHRKHLFVN